MTVTEAKLVKGTRDEVRIFINFRNTKETIVDNPQLIKEREIKVDNFYQKAVKFIYILSKNMCQILTLLYPNRLLPNNIKKIFFKIDLE